MKRLILLCLLLGACGDDAALADDVTADADPTAPDARADADPAAPDAGPDADPAAPDAGDGDAGQTCAALPCYYNCDGFTGAGCPAGTMCLYIWDQIFDISGYTTYCDATGSVLPGEKCDFTNDCVPGSICMFASNDGNSNRCHEQCTASSPGCQCLVYDDHTINGELIRYCRYN